MSQEEKKKREKNIRFNFTSILLLMSAITIEVVAGVAYITYLLI